MSWRVKSHDPSQFKLKSPTRLKVFSSIFRVKIKISHLSDRGNQEKLPYTGNLVLHIQYQYFLSRAGRKRRNTVLKLKMILTKSSVTIQTCGLNRPEVCRVDLTFCSLPCYQFIEGKSPWHRCQELVFFSLFTFGANRSRHFEGKTLSWSFSP